MIHPFALRCYDIDALLHNVGTLSKFMKNLSSQSLEKPLWIEPSKYTGGGFEAFVESLFIQSPISKKLYMSEPEPILTNDMGVDFVGKGLRGEVHTYQAKFRSDVRHLLNTKDDQISNFFAHSVAKYSDKDGTIPMMTIITTCSGIHPSVDTQMYCGKVRCINYAGVANLVNDNDVFWRKFREHLEQRLIDG